MSTVVKSTCPYCGVGCGVVASLDQTGQVTVDGDQQHPANFGRLCSKGSALAQTLDLDDRLLAPEINGEQVDWDTALDTVAKGFQQVIAEHGPNAVAFYVSGQLLTEDYYVANKLMKGFIGSANIDTNSRLCMSSTVAGYKRAFGSDTVPCSYEDLERAKLIVLAGTNTAWCHPVLFQRIMQAKQDNPDLYIVVIDPRVTPTCDIADLHLPLRPGTDAVLFNGLLNHLDQCGERNELFVTQYTLGVEDTLASCQASAPSIERVAVDCGLPPQHVAEFYRLFARTERVVTVFSQGINQSSSGSDKVNAIINCHLFTGRIGRPGMGPFSFTGQPNAMGGREVGGLSNQLAAHMEIANAEHRQCVQQFWQSPVIADQEGLKAVELFAAIAAGQVKAVWIMGTNPAVSLPDAGQVIQALKQCELVVVSDCMRHTDTTALATVLLPVLPWGEKDGTVTNSERRISRQRAFLPAAGQARADWWVICQVARRLGFAAQFSYKNVAAIFREHAQLSGERNDGSRDFDISALAALDDGAYDNLIPLQWPVRRDQDQYIGTPRLFSQGHYFTASSKAHFVAVTPRPVQYALSEDFPLVLNTGRVRDQWHTMTRTGKSPRLSEHSPEPYAEIHPADARDFAIADGALVRVFSRWGEVIVRAKLSSQQQQGSVFVPMHWNDQFASNGGVDQVVNPAVDPLSGQPEFKHTPVRIMPYTPGWHGFILSRRFLQLQDISYWVRARGAGYYRYEIAGDQSPQDWPGWSRDLLCASDDDINWIEYLDASRRHYRGVRLVGKTVESCIFIAPSHELPPRSWLASLFQSPTLSDAERRHLLAGRPADHQQETGPVVCACFGVGQQTLIDAISKDGLNSVAAIGDKLKAGTNCGSCIPELKALLAQQSPT